MLVWKKNFTSYLSLYAQSNSFYAHYCVHEDACK